MCVPNDGMLFVHHAVPVGRIKEKSVIRLPCHANHSLHHGPIVQGYSSRHGRTFVDFKYYTKMQIHIWCLQKFSHDLMNIPVVEIDVRVRLLRMWSITHSGTFPSGSRDFMPLSLYALKLLGWSIFYYFWPSSSKYEMQPAFAAGLPRSPILWRRILEGICQFY